MNGPAVYVIVAVSLAVVPAASEAPHQTPDQRMQRGVELLSENRVGEALAEFEAVVAARPDFPSARYYMGQALNAAGRYEEAIEHLRTGLPDAPDKSAFRIVLGQSLIELDRLSEARAALDAAAEESPGLPRIPYYLARICYRTGSVDAALEGFARAAEMAPDWTAPRLRGADIAFERGDLATAAAFYRAVLDIDPGRTAVWIKYGDALAGGLEFSAVSVPSSDDFEGPLGAYESAVASDPESEAARIALAYFLFNRQHFDEARASIEDFLRRSPSNAYALLLEAEIRILDGADEEALDSLERALENQNAEASAAGSESISASRFRIDLLELQARALMNLNRLLEAESVARGLLLADPLNVEGFYVLGTTLMRAGRPEGRDYLGAFQRLSDARLHRDLGFNYYRSRNEPARAASEFEEALRINPNDTVALIGLGTVRNAQGDQGAAIEALSQAWQAGADSTDWYREWILALHAAGRTDEATRLWQQMRAGGTTLGPRVWAALGRHEGAC